MWRTFLVLLLLIGCADDHSAPEGVGTEGGGRPHVAGSTMTSTDAGSSDDGGGDDAAVLALCDTQDPALTVTGDSAVEFDLARLYWLDPICTSDSRRQEIAIGAGGCDHARDHLSLVFDQRDLNTTIRPNTTLFLNSVGLPISLRYTRIDPTAGNLRFGDCDPQTNGRVTLISADTEVGAHYLFRFQDVSLAACDDASAPIRVEGDVDVVVRERFEDVCR